MDIHLIVSLTIVIMLLFFGFLNYKIDSMERNMESILLELMARQVKRLAHEAELEINDEFNQLVEKRLKVLVSEKAYALDQRIGAIEDKLKKKKVGRPRKVKVGKDNKA